MRLIQPFLTLMRQPLRTYQQWGIVLIVALALLFAPQVSPNDWELNARGLEDGVNLYDNNPDYVYPPWALILLWPYRLMGAALTRVLMGLAIGWLVYEQGWAFSRYLAVILSPFFIFTTLFSNIDIFVTIVPVLLWRRADASPNPRWGAVFRTLALALVMLKPQAGAVLILLWLWGARGNWRPLWIPGAVVALIVVPVSLIGSPPLVLQWLDNIRDPSSANIDRWAANNVSLSTQIGLPLAALVVGLVLAGLYVLMRQRGRAWTSNHTVALWLLAAILLSPYASNQTVIGALGLVPSWALLGVQYGVVLGAGISGVYQAVVGGVMLLCGVSALWLYHPAPDDAPDTPPSAVGE